MREMAWFLCSTSRSRPENWARCKDVKLWAVTTGSRSRADRRVEIGDHLLFWIGGRGYSAYGVVTEPPRPPRDKSEAPWAGGIYAYRTVIPFEVQLEVARPLFLPFVKARQVETDFPSVLFQNGLSPLSDIDASRVVQHLLLQELDPGTEYEATTWTS